MDIKDLNKSQLIMLAIFLSFITSIATGITTVTLMQQAPPSVTAPINHVVQQTVDRIEQVEGKTVTQTVVVKEEDLVVDAISKNQTGVFTVSKQGYDLNDAPTQIPIGRAFAVSKNNIVVTDANIVSGGGAYYVKNSSGTFKASFILTDKGFSFLKIGDPIDSTSKLAYTVPTFGDISKMKTGQEIIVLGNNVSTSTFQGNPNDISLNVGKNDGGALVMDLDGDALGIALSGDTSFVSINTISDTLKPIDTPAPGTPATP